MEEAQAREVLARLVSQAVDERGELGTPRLLELIDQLPAETREAVSRVALLDGVTKMVREMLDEDVAAGRMVKVGPDRYQRVTPSP